MTDTIAMLGDWTADEYAGQAFTAAETASKLVALVAPDQAADPETATALAAAASADEARALATLALAATIREAAASITAALKQRDPQRRVPPWQVGRVARNVGNACVDCGAMFGLLHKPGCVHDSHEHRSDVCVEEGT